MTVQHKCRCRMDTCILREDDIIYGIVWLGCAAMNHLSMGVVYRVHILCRIVLVFHRGRGCCLLRALIIDMLKCSQHIMRFLHQTWPAINVAESITARNFTMYLL